MGFLEFGVVVVVESLYNDDIGQSGIFTFFFGKKIHISSSLGLFCKANDELPPQNSCTGQEMSKSVKRALICFHLQGKKDMPISIHLCLLFWVLFSFQNRLLSSLQNPINCPVSLTHPTVPSIAAFTNPFAFLPLRSPRPPRLPSIAVTLLVSPVAYSLPMLGSTFSPALKETNSANGTSHTQRPKYDAISVKDGMSRRS